MSWTITESFVKQYTNSVYHLQSQGESKLRDKVALAPPVVGTRQFQERVGVWNPQQAGVRHGVTPLIPIDWSKRALDVTDWEGGELFDELDKLKALVDPVNPVTMEHRKGFNRRIDQTLINAFTATVVTQADETGTATFPTSTHQIAADLNGDATNEGLTVDKLKRAAFILNDYHVDEADRFVAISAKGLEQLQNDTEFTDHDFNMLKPLFEGKPGFYLGFTMVMFGGSSTATGPRLPKTGDIRSCYAWQRNSMRLGFGKEPTVTAGQNMERKGNWTIYTCMSVGAVRMDEVGVVEILIDETK